MHRRFHHSLRPLILALSLSAGIVGTSIEASSQEFKDLKPPEAPLVLKDRGSFFVGGEKVEQTSGELGSLGPADQITINQMYVEYMIPDGTAEVPVVMVHGAT